MVDTQSARPAANPVIPASSSTSKLSKMKEMVPAE